MHAVIVREFGGPEVMHFEDVPEPALQASQVLVRMQAAGVNPVDTYIRSGTYARKPPLPYVPGLDGAGVVERVGADVAGFKAGDRVYVANDGRSLVGVGTYTELAACEPAMLHPLPDRVTFGQGAALGVPYVTAYRALVMRARAEEGETVLVHGATGGTGIAAVQIAHARGLKVFGTGGTEGGMRLVREQGADLVVSHHEPNYLDAVMKATGGRGVDVVLEMAAHANLDKDLSILARFGRIVVIGARGRVEIDPRQTMGRDAAILGMTSFNITPEELDVIHGSLAEGLASGAINPIVAREMPLADAVRAHEAVMQPGALGKIVLRP